MVEEGVIVDYFSSRQTAMELEAWYSGRGEEVRSRGCTYGLGQTWPEVGIPNLTLEPGKEDVSVDDLIADTRRGFYVVSAYASPNPASGGGADQQLISAQFAGGGGRGREIREIRNGKLGRAVQWGHFAFQFLTPEFWKKLDAIGGPTPGTPAASPAGLGNPSNTLRNPLRYTMPVNWRDALSTGLINMSAVPVRVREVNVLNPSRSL